MDERLSDIGERLKKYLGDTPFSLTAQGGEGVITIDSDAISRALLFLRNDSGCRFTLLIDICGVDYPERTPRFEVVYHILSLIFNLRLRLKVATDGSGMVPSVCEVFPCADWYEREVWDMFGVPFANHPDLRRILTDYGFEGHPLRKDFPLTGHVEVRYDEERKKVVYEPVHLTQEFRDFDFLSPWDGPMSLPGDEKAGDEKANDEKANDKESGGKRGSGGEPGGAKSGLDTRGGGLAKTAKERSDPGRATPPMPKRGHRGPGPSAREKAGDRAQMESKATSQMESKSRSS